MKYKSVAKVIMDLTKHMQNEGLTNRDTITNYIDKNYFHYDRGNFMKSVGGNVSDEQGDYQADIATLSVEICQMIMYGHIIYEVGEKKDMRHRRMIKE